MEVAHFQMVHQNSLHLLLPHLPQGPGLGSESLVSLTFPLPMVLVWASLVVQMVKNSLAMQENWV